MLRNNPDCDHFNVCSEGETEDEASRLLTGEGKRLQYLLLKQDTREWLQVGERRRMPPVLQRVSLRYPRVVQGKRAGRWLGAWVWGSI